MIISTLEENAMSAWMEAFSSNFNLRIKWRVTQKTKESLLFVQVVVIIMDECPEGMQKKHAFYWAKRSYKEVNGKAKT